MLYSVNQWKVQLLSENFYLRWKQVSSLWEFTTGKPHCVWFDYGKDREVALLTLLIWDGDFPPFRNILGLVLSHPSQSQSWDMCSQPSESQPCLPRRKSLYLVHLQVSTAKQIEITSLAGVQTEGQRQLKVNQASWKKSFTETVVTTAWNMEEIH